ncbi:DUF2101 family protein [Pyrococcus sp. ST04]|uniref:DUF2101 family protein n=1 Tax=Pyrococcus sp. ST04 TaxID=1183377 RepID=UPI0002605B05|nr:DUF2101 family protein [Pyrococcus sp. ST04]AFK22816.1 hypothetical protein Py04_1242 [Pyrococcus sp. ST04]
MAIIELLDKIGQKTEEIFRILKSFLFPKPTNKPPILRLKKYTLHETFSLQLQLSFILYLIVGVILIILNTSILLLIAISIFEFLFIRYTLVRGSDYIINIEAYRYFYHGLVFISAIALVGYEILRNLNVGILYLYVFIIAITLLVLGFRNYFKMKFGREYTYGIVEEVKNNLVKVFVHDDIAANVKPGYYWIEKGENVVNEGDLVKIVVEDRIFRGAVPKAIIEVLQSSQTSTEPKEDME